MNKVCSICNIEKELNKFGKKSIAKDGKRPECKECQAKNSKKYREENKQKIANFFKKYYRKNRKRILKKQKQYEKNNAQKISQRKKQYYKNNIKKINDRSIQYQQKNKEIVRKKRRKYRQQRLKNDPTFRLASYYRTRVWKMMKVKFIQKRNKTFDILGCSIEEFWSHLEKQFTNGMTRENYGKWHIDHIVPLSSAKTKKELETLFHYSNCQPLWAKDNCSKNNKLDWYITKST